MMSTDPDTLVNEPDDQGIPEGRNEVEPDENLDNLGTETSYETYEVEEPREDESLIVETP